MNKKKIILIAVSIAVVAGAGFWLFGSSKAQHKVTYETAVVTRGEISESITATGTIEPVFSRLDKERTWLLCSGGAVIWIVGERSDNRFCLDKTTKSVLVVNFFPTKSESN